MFQRDTYHGIRRMGRVKVGVVEVDWVYNPIPPFVVQVYTAVKIRAVTKF